MSQKPHVFEGGSANEWFCDKCQKQFNDPIHAAPVTEQQECKLAPAGWRCTRVWNHSGPCAAVPDVPEPQPNSDHEQAIKDVADYCKVTTHKVERSIMLPTMYSIQQREQVLAQARRIAELEEALYECECALDCCYDVCDYPADGQSIQDEALNKTRAILAKKGS
jgi:hypothetical protein